MTTTSFPQLRVLASGRVAYVDADRKAHLETCTWLVRVPSNNPEPDSEADCWLEVDCGAPVFALDATADDTVCAHGHERFAMGGARWLARDAEEAWAEAQEGGRF